MQFSSEAIGTLTAEQIQQRIGKLTASRMGDAMSFLKNGKESSERARYKMELVAERMTDIIVPHYTTPAMEWGIVNEPAAKLAYQDARPNSRLHPAGFYDHPSIDWCGATPDGLIDSDGLIECKCPTTLKFLNWILLPGAPEEHHPQMALQMLCTGRAWVDFVAHDPRIPKPRSLIIRRFVPTDEYLRRVEDAAKQFLREVDELFESVTTCEIA